MAEVTKTIENVDLLFSQIEVNGQTYESERYIEPEPELVPAPVVTQPETQGDQSTPSVPATQTQGQNVHAVDLNNVLHNFVDPVIVQALENEVTARENADISLQGDVDDIEALIPNQATAENQLADKNFVNSSVATNTANFLGTYTSIAQIEAIPNPTNNDYAYLDTVDQAGNTKYDRYKYSSSDSQWHYEYTLNNSSFTAEQWATINSGLTQSSIENAINDLDVAPVGGAGLYIESISEKNGKVSAVAGDLSSAISSALGAGVLNIVYPVGCTYTQYPKQMSPMELWGTLSTWEVIDYGGASFRADGGNSIAYDTNEKAITVVSGNTITIASHGASVGTVIFDFNNNESRVVTAVSGNVLTLNSQFTSTNLRNVLIGQSSQNRYHTHNAKHDHSASASSSASTSVSALLYKENNGSTSARCISNSSHGNAGWGGDFISVGATTIVSTSVTVSNKDFNVAYDGNSSVQEARSENFTYKVWVRTA